jgi:two-component system probable response regulator PhcQ
MPGAYGNALLEYAKSNYPNIVRILTTAYSELEHTVEAVNQGQIHRYLQKPWEITALRMELKQALDLASLRWDHAQLLREKLMIRQKQLISNRIAVLYVLSASRSNPDDILPLESYLSAASAAGVTPPEPDWLLMDHADMISAEALRGGKFGNAVSLALSELGKRDRQMDEKQTLEVLLQWCGDQVTLLADGALAFADERLLTEFLEKPADVPVSVPHARWFAYGWQAKVSDFESRVRTVFCKLTFSRRKLRFRLRGWRTGWTSSDSGCVNTA